MPGWLPLDADRWIYHIALAVAVIAFVATHNLLSGRIGRALAAIRDNPLAAEAMGIDLHVYKCLTFGISALLTGLAGGVSALAIEFVAPESFPVYLSVFLLVGLVVGGVGTVPGAVLGAAFIVLAPIWQPRCRPPRPAWSSASSWWCSCMRCPPAPGG
ncbi:hypothetical protein ACFQ4K_34195 [Tistrella bauzanensis]